MRTLRSFAAFWYDFVVGDDWRAAVLVAAALAGTWLLHRAGVPAWWLVPVMVVGALAVTLAGAYRRRPG
jgi:hypothetical protein